MVYSAFLDCFVPRNDELVMMDPRVKPEDDVQGTWGDIKSFCFSKKAIQWEKIFSTFLSMASKNSRLPLLDIARGIMVIIMITYHALYLLQYVFSAVNVFSDGIFWRIFTATGWGIFVFIAGISAALSWKKREFETSWKNTFVRYCLRRTAILAILAAVITLLTQKFQPDQIILFWILHFFTIGFLLLPFFSRLKKWGFIFSLILIILGIFFFTKTFSIEYFWMFWLRNSQFFSADYYPIFPYFWVLLLWFFSGKSLIESWKMEKVFSPDFYGSLLIRWLGKNTLVIYLLHVPILYGVFWLIFSK